MINYSRDKANKERSRKIAGKTIKRVNNFHNSSLEIFR
jgi:hypothetical protein